MGFDGRVNMFGKKIGIILFVLILLFLVACQNEPATVDPDKSNRNQKNNEEIDIEIQSDDTEKDFETRQEVDQKNLSLESMKEQKAGILIHDTSFQFELEKTSNNSLHVEHIGKIVDELGEILAVTNEPNEIYEGIVYLFGSSNYKELIEKAEDFEPQFDEPYLPSLGAEQDVDLDSNREKTIILIDANSNMLEPIDGKKQLDIVKDALIPFVEILGQSNEIALIVYGHQSNLMETDKDSCKSVEEIYPMGVFEKDNFEQTLATVEGYGKSPLAEAIQKATEVSGESEEVSLYIISKAAETCNGNPEIATEAFIDGYPERSVHILGFDVEESVGQELKQLAFSGQGTYYSAENEEQLKNVIENKWLKTFIDLVITHTTAPGPWDILDEYNRFDSDLNRVRDVIKEEKRRYDQAIQIMRIENLSSEDVINQVSHIMNKEYRSKLEVISDFRSEKLAEIDQKAEKIRYSVEKWKDEMKQ